MPRTKISEFSSTPASNTDIDSINIAENCPPSGINDAIRELMAQLKDWQSGTSNDPYVVGSSGSLTLNQGTANGVTYLNGSKVVTSGSALTFDGTRLTSTTGKFGGGAASNSASLMVNNATNTATGIQLFQDGIESWIMGMPANSAGLAWSASGSEQMRLTSTGLGIGTTSPGQKLTVAGTQRIQKEGAGYEAAMLSFSTVSETGAIYRFGMASGGSFAIGRSDTAVTNLTLDSSGNLGLGVTPSAWGGSYKAFQITNAARSLAATGAGAGDLTLAFNAIYDSTDSRWEYAGTGDKAGRYSQTGAGDHVFYVTNTTGTAGNAITFTQAMTLDASGNLGIGATSSLSPLTIERSGGTSSEIKLNQTGGSGRDFRIASTGSGYGSAGNLIFYDATASAERCRIDSSGNLLVGTTSAVTEAKISAVVSGQQAAAFRSDASTVTTIVNLWGNETSGNQIFVRFATDSNAERGSITYNRAGGLVAYNVTSDYRAKDIYGVITDSGALIDSVPVYMGKMKGATQERPMFIAHETPSYAHTGEKDAVDEDGNPVYQQMDASALIPVMWAEIQSLRKRLADANL